MPNTDNMIQIGTIVNVDSENRALVRVELFERVTDWIPYKMVVNSHIQVWIPPRVGEQVIVLSPFGDGDDGIVLGGIYNIDQKEPTGSNDHTTVVTFEDGTSIMYDASAKALTINAFGSVAVTAPSGMSITADVSITGNLNVSGTITDEKGSLTSHVHSGVMAGGSNTGVRP